MRFRTVPGKKKASDISRGHRAKRAGDDWENMLSHAAFRSGAHVVKIPSGCRWVSATRAISVKTPFDFVFLRQGIPVFADAKTTMASAWGYAANDPHQVRALLRCEQAGSRAGYIVNFRELEIVAFFSATQLAGLRPRQSLKPSEGIQLIGDSSRIDLRALFDEPRKQKDPDDQRAIGTDV